MPRIAVPDEVMEAVAGTPALWPVILQIAPWFHDATTGRIEIRFGDGEVRDLEVSKRFQQGKRIALPAGQRPYCPACTGPVAERDYGQNWHCQPCDVVWTVWELKRRGAFGPVAGVSCEDVELPG